MITTHADTVHTADSTIYRGRKTVTVEQSNPGFLVTVRTRDWDRIRQFTCGTYADADQAARQIAGLAQSGDASTVRFETSAN